MFDKSRIKYTPTGFSYVEVTFDECLAWGGLGICDMCNKQEVEGPLYLVWVLHDVFCKKCFEEWSKRTKTYSKEDIDYDLKLQKDNDVEFYKAHLDSGEEDIFEPTEADIREYLGLWKD